MKVIGMTTERNGQYICVVEHVELEKLTDKYYGNLKPLKVGDSMNLGQGHDFRSDIKSACTAMQDAEKRFDSAKATLMRFAVMVSSLPAPVEAE